MRISQIICVFGSDYMRVSDVDEELSLCDIDRWLGMTPVSANHPAVDK